MDIRVMGLTIHQEPQKARLVTMGQADKIIHDELTPEQAETLDAHIIAEQPAVATTDPPLEPSKPHRGRPKKMAQDKDLGDVSGVKTIRKDDPADQGAIGTGGANAPAQEKVPEKPAEGNKEGSDG